MIRLLGLDPGSRNLGWGVIEVDGSRLLHVDHGTLSAPAHLHLASRLALLYEGLEAVFDRFSPQSVGLEQVFAGRNSKSALTLGQARGAALVCVGRRNLELAEYAPSEVKLAVGGHGHASKAQLARMLERVLGVDLSASGADSTDALAIAVCHAHGRRRQKLIDRARAYRA